MNGVNINLNLLHTDSCEICGTLTCELLPYQDILREYYEMLDLQDDVTNKQKRLQSYLHWMRIYHKVLGTRVMKQLPVCAKVEIERRSPYKVGGNYVRFCSAD